MPAADDLRRILRRAGWRTAGRALLIAAAAAVGPWFVAPAVLRVGDAHALLSIAVFVGTALVLVPKRARSAHRR